LAQERRIAEGLGEWFDVDANLAPLLELHQFVATDRARPSMSTIEDWRS